LNFVGDQRCVVRQLAHVKVSLAEINSALAATGSNDDARKQSPLNFASRSATSCEADEFPLRNQLSSALSMRVMKAPKRAANERNFQGAKTRVFPDAVRFSAARPMRGEIEARLRCSEPLFVKNYAGPCTTLPKA